jgi:hypothetical protein
MLGDRLIPGKELSRHADMPYRNGHHGMHFFDALHTTEMPPSDDAETIRRCERENRDLKDTVRALNARMQQMCREHEELLQQSLTIADSENRELKATVQSLREKLDSAPVRTNTENPSAISAIQSQNAALRATVNSLLEQLEKERTSPQPCETDSIAHECTSDAGRVNQRPATRCGTDDVGERQILPATDRELNELRTTILQLREQLELLHKAYEEKLGRQESIHRAERRHLEETIRTQREKLHELSGSER